MDTRVLEVQQWLNNTFPTYFYYDENGTNSGSYPVKPDGMTGNTTVKALVMALQITLSLSPVDGIWGNATNNACPTISSSTSNSTLLKIVQSGLICKGYNPGPLDGLWGSSTSSAICQFKTDLGFTNPAATLSNYFFKSLLTTDPSIAANNGNSYIRMVQQYLNSNYSYLFVSSLGYIPTGGIFERKTSKAIIYAFQSCIGTTPDGILGPATFSLMPTLAVGLNNNANIVKILQAALICNQFIVSNLSGVFDSDTSYAVSDFQTFMCLNNDSAVTLGSVNRRTWGALLWSKGDTERDYNAIDTSKRLTIPFCSYLYQQGIRYIGRYLTKLSETSEKNMTADEITIIHNSGFNIIPLFQENNNIADDFSYLKGYESWNKAILAATKLRIPPSIIYFCVDFDVTEYQAETIVKDFFQGINDAKNVNPSIYQIGIYSSRNTCRIILNQNLATGCYISDMSSAYSGNLGFTIPEFWNFDQFYETSITIGNQSIPIDKVIASGNDTGFSAFPIIGNDNWNLHSLNYTDISNSANTATAITNVIPLIYSLENAFTALYPNANETDCLYAVLYYLWKDKYPNTDFNISLPTNNDFYNAIETNPAYAQLKTSISTFIKGNYLIIKDSQNKLLELPHLAVVIAAYLDVNISAVKSEWFGWAGDLATAFKEIKLLKASLGNAYIDDITHARDRIGRMEISPDIVQFNYCDFYADMDGFNIYTLIEKEINTENNSNHLLSNILTYYYGSTFDSSSRLPVFINNLPITEYNITSMTTQIKNYFLDPAQFALRSLKSNMANPSQDDINIITACCKSFTEILMHEFSLVL